MCNTKLQEKANSGHTHDDRYYTESEVNNKLSGFLHAETVIISPALDGITLAAEYNIGKSGYTPIGVIGFEIGINQAVWLQRCEIIGQVLCYTIRTVTNEPASVQVFFDVTILYAHLGS